MLKYNFRGMSLDGRWIFGSLVDHADTVLVKTGLRGAVAVRPETVGICSGLRDADGRDVFEGDILEAADGHRFAVVGSEDLPALVAMSSYAHTYNKKTRMSPEHLAREAGSSRIIGNIHENADLLEEKAVTAAAGRVAGHVIRVGTKNKEEKQ